MDAASVLDAALECHDLGWSIIPIKPGTKIPGCKSWKSYQYERPDRARLKKWFRNYDDRGLAVILGDASGGLACRDFDNLAAYERWAKTQPELAETLPTVLTPRGRHVYFLSTCREMKKFDDGEYRGGNGYCILPPSIHPSGAKYRWLRSPDKTKIPLIDVAAGGFFDCAKNQTERTETTEITETTDAIGSGGGCRRIPPELVVCSGISDWASGPGKQAVEQAIELAISGSIPKHHGQRNHQVFDLARALKAIPELAEVRPRELKPLVLRWHGQSLDNIQTKDFNETWMDFVHAWPKVLYPKGDEPMQFIVERALTGPLPPEALGYDSDKTRRLIAICHALQVSHGAGEPFYLSCRKAAELIGENVKHDWAARCLNMLVADDVLALVKAGGPHNNKATRYLYRTTEPAKPNQPR